MKTEVNCEGINGKKCTLRENMEERKEVVMGQSTYNI